MNHKTRNPHHDYRSKCIYLITLNKEPGVEPFSICYGSKEELYSDAGVHYLKNGKIIRDCLSLISGKFPISQLLCYIIMPDHIHFVISIKERSSYHLGDIISDFTRDCNKLCAQARMFEPGYHDRILRQNDQLRIMINYVKHNPRKRLIRDNCREYFSQPKIIEIEGKDYLIYGNFFLLKEPYLSTVIFSSKYSSLEMERMNRQWEECFRGEGVLISPFIHPVEKQVAKQGYEEGAKYILITRDEIGERYKPSGKAFDLCAEGRLLVISTYRPGQPEHLTRAESLNMNKLALAIERGAGCGYILRNPR